MDGSDFAVPILLLAMESSPNMGGSLRERAGPISRDGHGFSRAQAPPIPLPLLRLHSLLAAASLLLAPLLLRVYALLGESGTYYGVRFGKSIPWVTRFPFGVVRDPQYVGSILSLVACVSWVPLSYILMWVLGYVFMIHVESKEDPSTRAKPLD
ncbi:unnamed protein product [Cuscuta campestris]|uniref:phosphatidyl-N-methylethanolamine N-methyltransferase n=1 Tax=Cuscuta campestris TaxID=132261 RepID=A0A484MEX3_9ASTE|nr:unnamed protein product [Cuscuta campestris]